MNKLDNVDYTVGNGILIENEKRQKEERRKEAQNVSYVYCCKKTDKYES